ncbi:THTPA-like protein [Mya arenaria]|uniref:THTPA-like protein n=1 Tax=Mya arenaria TaxID=6604 RepID=A0ABY7EU23_MYAAR|nr:THTPA-like protein [Mya arenaria]
MATMENGVSPPSELHFVDHVERKLLSPDREVISPTKSPDKPFSTVKDVKNAKDGIEKVVNTSDSGLDSSNTSSEDTHEVENNSFIDRQESYTKTDEPEKITSPNKSNNSSLQFQDSEARSLDAANNNSEAGLDTLAGEVDVDKMENDVYLGKEVDLHERRLRDENKLNNNEIDINAMSSDAKADSMDLYWYSNTLDLDTAELEAFKNSDNGTFTSAVQLTVGNGYYEAKQKGEEKESKRNDETKGQEMNIKTTSQKDVTFQKDWSPAFESASSRILGLASEMSSEPKTKKNRDNASIKNGNKSENHPWGLEPENKLMEKKIAESKTELPDIECVQSSEMKAKLMNQYHSEASINLNPRDDVDSIALMDEKKSVTSVVKVTTLKSFKDIDIGKGEEGGLADQEHGKEEFEDDAIGYMELADRPQQVQDTITMTKQVTLETAVAVQDGNYRTETGDSFKVMSQKLIETTDEADAVGYMEMKDKPVEEVLKSSEHGSLESSVGTATISSDKEISLNTSVQSQTITAVKIDAGVKNVALAEGFDTPDGEKKSEKNAKKKQKKAQARKRQAEAKVKAVFEPFTVKRTYVSSEESEENVQKKGGIFIETETLVDEYLDDEDYSLILNDCWLRLRNKKFEMKVNAAFGYGKTRPGSFLNNENEIKELLLNKYSEKLEQKRKVSERHLDVLIDTLGLEEFATFETTRARYQVGNFMVTSELSNMGFHVGEIEVIVNSPQEFAGVLDKMEMLAAEIEET